MKTSSWLYVALMLTPAFAQGDEVLGASPRTFYFEAKVSPFTPNIDQGFADPGPYKSTFGSTFMWLGEAELDFQFFQKLGSLALGLSVGYAEKYGPAQVAATGQASSQSTGLHLLPVKALLVYRFDWLNLKFNIPLVPYIKGGPVIMPWWVTKGADLEVVHGTPDIRGAGYKLGLSGTLGLAFCLDFLDRRLARDFDTSMGVNHSYLFAEGTVQNMVLFEPASNSRPLNLSSLHVMFGLGLEF